MSTGRELALIKGVIGSMSGGFSGATDESNGSFGFVPAPSSAERTLYLRADGTWADPDSEQTDTAERILALEEAMPSPSDTNPEELGTAAPGESSDYSRADHVHGIPDTVALKADVDAELATKADAEDLGITNKRVDNLAALLNGALSMQNTDSTEAYTKSVPAGVVQNAEVQSIAGKTLVWNQLCDNGTITSSAYSAALPVGATVVSGRVYYITSDFSNSSGGQIYLYTKTNGTNQSIINIGAAIQRRIFTASYGGVSNGSVNSEGSLWIYTSNFSEGQTASNIMLIDLTLLYGAGNEPTTVEQFRAEFPADYYAYNPGTLLSAGVTDVKSVGKNLFDFNTYKTELLAQTSQATRGTVSFGDSTLTLVATGNDAYTTYVSPFDYKIEVKPSTAYTFSATYNGTGSGSFYIFQYKKDTTVITNSKISFANNGTQSLTINFGSSTAYIKVRFGVDTSGNSATFSNIQAEEGSTATAYTPYQSDTLPIPAAVQSLPGYGWSAGTVYNEVDWVAKKYIQRVGNVDMGSLTWEEGTDTTGQYFYTDSIIDRQSVDRTYPTIVSARYTVALSTNVGDKQIAYANGSYTKRVYVRDTEYTSAASYKAAMSGVMLGYLLDTSVETDISQYLTDDNLIEVEPGGTVTFPNSLGDDYRLPVPSDVEYTIDLAPDTPSTDGTYTLQCTVADGVATYSWVSA